MNHEYIALLQRKLAITSIGPSTARNMGPKGTIKVARQFLADLDLNRLKKRSSSSFASELDSITMEYMEALPEKAKYWGSARKFLNIFLMGVFYNRYLCEYFGLSRLEPWLEVPLDSHVAKGLLREPGSSMLPRWTTVIGLLPKNSREYQEFAQKVALSRHTYRVHLDLLYWRGSDTAEL